MRSSIRLSRMPNQDELLATRICDLSLDVDASPMSRYVELLYGELRGKGFRHFRPTVYFGDEWFSPEGVPAIAVPFYLAHPRLTRLEAEIMLDAEGADPDMRMRLLRHEAGHCFDHAFRLSRRTDYRAVFGARPHDYNPDSYLADPRSRDYVINLPEYYAQAHPDEDFAETFAVWLDPRSNWRKRYARWPEALRKLHFIDSLVQELCGLRPIVVTGPRPFSASSIKQTLADFYGTRTKVLERRPRH